MRLLIFAAVIFVTAACEQKFDSIIESPNVDALEYKMDDGVKVFHLVAEPIKQKFMNGLVVNAWGYNGSTPGPTIEAIEGDRVRIVVTNKLPAPTTVHWHGLFVPNEMDGVTGLNQAPIKPGETFTYEFTLKQHGTYMYHPHYDEMTQIGMGMMGFFIVHPREPEDPPIDRDFAIFTHEWHIDPGTMTPNPMEMLDFNYFTFNGKIYPDVEPLVVKKGERVRIRFANLSMDNHPIHLHGYAFTVTASGGFELSESAQYQSVTTDVMVGNTTDIEFIANEPGDWAIHCHKTHHLMAGMDHDVPNLLGVDQGDISKRIQKIFPDYMPMGETGMSEMLEMGDHMEMPDNFPTLGAPGPYGTIEMNGMFTVLKVREGITSYEDPGWYNGKAIAPNNESHMKHDHSSHDQSQHSGGHHGH